MRMRSRSVRALAALVLVGLVASGCSRIGLVYNRLDTLTDLEIGRYVDLDASQRADLAPRLDALWRWHRSTQLPLYVTDVRALQKTSAEPLTSVQFDAAGDRAQQNAEATWREVLRVAAPTLASLSDAQTASLLAQVEKRAAKDKRKQDKLTDADWAEQRAEDALDRLDEWAGSVTPAQRERIRQWSLDLVRPPADRLPPRRAAFADLMKKRHDADFGQRLEAYAMQPLRGLDPVLTDQRRRLLLDLSRLATAEQRAHLQDKLGALAAELDDLAQKLPPS